MAKNPCFLTLQNIAYNIMAMNLEAEGPIRFLMPVEDYLEVVYELIQRKGYARSSDIAEQLDV